jgi:hypothetical protein
MTLAKGSLKNFEIDEFFSYCSNEVAVKLSYFLSNLLQALQIRYLHPFQLYRVFLVELQIQLDDLG